MNKKTKIFLFLFAALTLFTFQKNFALAGFGISPPSVINNNLVPGSFYEQDIYLVQATPDVDLNAVVTVGAGNIKDWIKIENGNSFVIPKGMQQFPMKVDVTVPSDAKYGEYKGVITVNTTPAGSQKQGVSIVLGANISVKLNVTSIKVSDFSIQNFKVLDAQTGSPIRLVIKVKNDGNVENGPTKATLTFFDQYHSKQLGQQEQLITERAKAFETKDITVDFTNSFDVGSYWADVTIDSGDKTIISNNRMVFSVKLGGESILSKLSVISMWAYLLVVIVIVVIVLFFVRKGRSVRKGRNKKGK